MGRSAAALGVGDICGALEQAIPVTLAAATRLRHGRQSLSFAK